MPATYAVLFLAALAARLAAFFSAFSAVNFTRSAAIDCHAAFASATFPCWDSLAAALSLLLKPFDFLGMRVLSSVEHHLTRSISAVAIIVLRVAT
jgi:hypothetical protein